MTELRSDGVTIDDWAHEGGRSGAESDQQNSQPSPRMFRHADERARHFAQSGLDRPSPPTSAALANVVEITGLLNLMNWPAGMRVIIRREHPHPGAQLSLLEHADGWRLPSRRHQHQDRTGRVPRSQAPRPRPRRGPDPPRQGLRHRPVPVPRVRHQPSLGAGRLDRRRPDRVAALARAAPDLEGVRAQGAALPVPARPRPPDPQRPTTTPPLPGHLALGHRPRRRVHRHPRPDAAADLRASTPHPSDHDSTTRRPARSATRHHTMPSPQNRRRTLTPDSSVTLIKGRG